MMHEKQFDPKKQAHQPERGANESEQDVENSPVVGTLDRVRDWLEKWGRLFQIAFAALVIIVTCIYTWYASRQWEAMQSGIKETQQNRELEYRAYVGVRGVAFQPRADNPAWGNVILVSINTGRTPGLEGKIRQIVEKRDTPVPENTVINEPEHPGSKIVYFPSIEMQTNMGMITTNVADIIMASPINPNAKAKPSVIPIQPTVIPNLIPPIMPSSTVGYYVYGIIEYRDIFNKAHQTKFCFIGAPGTNTFGWCTTFNDAN
jgi:hypothetical protein